MAPLDEVAFCVSEMNDCIYELWQALHAFSDISETEHQNYQKALDTLHQYAVIGAALKTGNNA